MSLSGCGYSVGDQCSKDCLFYFDVYAVRFLKAFGFVSDRFELSGCIYGTILTIHPVMMATKN